MDAVAQSLGRQRAEILFAVVPPLALSAWLGFVLLRPLADTSTRQWALDAPMLMAMEFLLVHSGFLALAALGQPTPWRRATFAGALGAFYLLFVGAFWFVSGGSAVIGGAMVLLVARLAGGVLEAPPRGEVELRRATPVFNAVLYLILVAVTSASKGFPTFGFTPEVLAQLRPDFGTATGLWAEQPQRPVAFGALYFLVQGLFELARLRSVFAGGAGWTKIRGADVRMTPESIELRSNGATGALVIGTIVGGVPLVLGLSLVMGLPPGSSWGVHALGYALGAFGFAVLAYQLWRASCRVTTRASRNLLEVEFRWFVGYGILRLDAAALRQLAPGYKAGGRVGQWSLVLRTEGGEIEVARNLSGGEDTLALRQLIAERVQGSLPGNTP
jgi:hypothetical protein